MACIPSSVLNSQVQYRVHEYLGESDFQPTYQQQLPIFLVTAHL